MNKPERYTDMEIFLRAQFMQFTEQVLNVIQMSKNLPL